MEMPISPIELAVILGLIGLMGLESLIALRSRSWVQVYRPTLFVAVVLAFYALVGPLRAILSTGEAANFVGTTGTIYRGLDHRSFLIWGWLGALVFYGSLLIGFYLTKPKIKPFMAMKAANLSRIRLFGSCLCWFGLAMYLIPNGGRVISLLNPFDPQGFSTSQFGFSGFNVGAFENYFQLSINFLIPGILIQFTAWLRQRKNLASILAWTLLALLIFLSESFRYRILLLVIPMLLLWMFYNKQRPKLVFLLMFMVAFVALNGVIGLSRTSIRGLDLSRLSEETPVSIFNSSFEEAGVFFTTSAVIESVPEQIPFVGFKPFSTALLQPLPRKIFPNKPSGEYSNHLREQIYQSKVSFTAYLNYAEYYIIGGWLSLVAISIFLGVLLRRLWTWFLWRQYEPLAQSVYLLNASYLYVVVSRGYFPQVIMLYGLTVMPLIFIYYILSERV